MLLEDAKHMDIAGKLTYHFQEVLDEHACTLLRLAFCQDVGEPLADSAKHNRTMFKTSFLSGWPTPHALKPSSPEGSTHGLSCMLL